MKNIDKLIKLKKSHKIYFSCNGTSLLSKYLKPLAYDKEYICAPAESKNDDKILILAYLTSIDNVKPEIIISNKYKIKDHRRAGAINDLPCITAFLYCQETQLENELQNLYNLLC